MLAPESLEDVQLDGALAIAADEGFEVRPELLERGFAIAGDDGEKNGIVR